MIAAVISLAACLVITVGVLGMLIYFYRHAQEDKVTAEVAAMAQRLRADVAERAVQTIAMEKKDEQARYSAILKKLEADNDEYLRDLAQCKDPSVLVDRLNAKLEELRQP